MEQKLLSARKSYAYFGCVGFLFVFFCKTGRDLAAAGDIRWTASYTVYTLLFSIGVGGLLGGLLCRGIRLLVQAGGGRAPGAAKEPGERERFRTKPGLFWLGSTALILLAWLPAYLAYYPAICAYDVPAQLDQIGSSHYVEHHPLAHTLLLRFFLWLGRDVLGNINSGIALFAALQACLLAAVLGLGVLLLWQWKLRQGWIAAVQLLSMCYPFHWYMSISITKDTLFTVLFLLQIYALLLLLREDRRDWRIRGADVLFFAAGVGVILFRNNGKYAMLVLLATLFLTVWRGREARGLWRRLFVTGFAAFAAGLLLLGGLSRITHATQGDRREMLSVPIQQLSRCMLYHGGVGLLAEDDGTMDAEDAEMIRQFLPDEAYLQYQSDFADPVKRHTNTSAALRQAGQFIRTYLHLFAEYPGEYINAVLALDAGYLYPGDVSHAYVNQVDYAPGKGYAQTRWAEEQLDGWGICKASKWEGLHRRLEQWAEENSHLKLPVVKYLFVPGVFLWAYLVLLGGLLIARRNRMCIPLSLVLGYYLTLFLGPVVQLRYLYPLMTALPFLFLLGSCPMEGKESPANRGASEQKRDGEEMTGGDI